MAKEGSKVSKDSVGRCEGSHSVHGKTSPFLMWKALTDLFQSKSDQTKLALKDKLRKIKIEKNGIIPIYL